MSSSYQNSKKIINSFLVVGINKEKLQKYNLLSTNEEPQLSFIQNIDMINMNVLSYTKYYGCAVRLVQDVN